MSDWQMFALFAVLTVINDCKNRTGLVYLMKEDEAMGIVLKNILALVPENDTDSIQETSIYIEGSRIVAIGERPEGFREEKVIDGKDRFAIPGLVNCHTHSYMSFMRNVADDLSFMDWLFGSIDPIEIGRAHV